MMNKHNSHSKAPGELFSRCCSKIIVGSYFSQRGIGKSLEKLVFMSPLSSKGGRFGVHRHPPPCRDESWDPCSPAGAVPSDTLDPEARGSMVKGTMSGPRRWSVTPSCDDDDDGAAAADRSCQILQNALRLRVCRNRHQGCRGDARHKGLWTTTSLDTTPRR